MKIIYIKMKADKDKADKDKADKDKADKADKADKTERKVRFGHNRTFFIIRLPMLIRIISNYC